MPNVDEQFLRVLQQLGQSGQQYGVKRQMDQVNERAAEIQNTMQDEIQRRQALQRLAQQASVSVAGSGGNAQQQQAIQNLLPPIPSSVQQAYLQGSLTGDQQMTSVAEKMLNEDEQRKIRLMEKDFAMKLALQEKQAKNDPTVNFIKKENYKTYSTLADTVSMHQDTLAKISRIKKLIGTSGTGWYDGGVKPMLSSDAQELQRLMSELSLDKLIKDADGKASLFNSNVEREAFTKAQPSMTGFESNNLSAIQTIENASRSILRKAQAKREAYKATNGMSMDYYDEKDAPIETPEGFTKAPVSSKVSKWLTLPK